MLLNRLAFTTALIVFVTFTGCDVPTVESPIDAADAGGVGPNDTGATTAMDGSDVLEAVADTETMSAPDSEFVIGVNVTGKNTPEFFSELPEDGDLFVELGAQGLWMVVLAFGMGTTKGRAFTDVTSWQKHRLICPESLKDGI